MPVPRTWSGYLDQTDLSPNFKLPTGFIPQGTVTPDQIGMSVWNATGSDIAAGKLVYISGWNAAHAMPQVTLATASTPNTLAAFVSLGVIPNGGSSLVGKHFQLTGQNTNAATVGDAVYLSATAGGFDLTNPGSTVGFVQNTGRVAVKSASVGVVDFDLLAAPLAGIVTAITAAFEPTTIPTTGSAEALFRVPIAAGTLINFTVFGKDALATSDSNFIQYSGTNHGHVDGSGSTAMLNVSSGNSSTKVTGGQALIAYGGTSLVPSATPGNLVVAFGDIIALTATITGTLANTVSESYALMRLLPASA